MKRAFLSSPTTGSVKDKRGGNNMMMLMKGDRQHLSGATADYYTWPRRDYTCSYCKRQFSSAQALGGHMNVHRRERARLRLLPPLQLAEGPNPNSGSNPNHDFSSISSHSAKFLPYPYGTTTSQHSPSLPSLSSPPYCQENKLTVRSSFLNLLTPRFEDLGKKESLRVLADKVGEVKKEKGSGNKLDFLNKGNEIAGLDFGIGSKDPKEDLDLELRLGCL